VCKSVKNQSKTISKI